MIAVAARDAGFDVIYAGIRLEPGGDRAVRGAGGVDVVGAVGAVGLARRARARGDRRAARARRRRHRRSCSAARCRRPITTTLRALGIRRVFTPSDYQLVDVVGALLDLVRPTS